MMTLSTLPALLQAFFMDRLMQQRQASPHTVASYRDTFRLLLQFAQQRLSKAPSQLTVPDLDTPLLGAFLRTQEQRSQPQCAPGGDPLILSLRGTACT